MAMQELESLASVDFVSADEPFDGAILRQLEAGVVKMAHLGKLESDLFVGAHWIGVPALDHERTWRD